MKSKSLGTGLNHSVRSFQALRDFWELLPCMKTKGENPGLLKSPDHFQVIHIRSSVMTRAHLGCLIVLDYFFDPFLDSSLPLCFPQFCNFQKRTFAPGGWHGAGQDHPGHLHCCLLPAGMALAGGHSFFCEVYVGRGTVSLGTCTGSVKSLCDGWAVLCFAKVKLLNVLRQRNKSCTDLETWWWEIIWCWLYGICLIFFFILTDFLFVVQLICWEEGQLEKVCPLTLC